MLAVEITCPIHRHWVPRHHCKAREPGKGAHSTTNMIPKKNFDHAVPKFYNNNENKLNANDEDGTKYNIELLNSNSAKDSYFFVG